MIYFYSPFSIRPFSFFFFEEKKNSNGYYLHEEQETTIRKTMDIDFNAENSINGENYSINFTRAGENV